MDFEEFLNKKRVEFEAYDDNEKCVKVTPYEAEKGNFISVKDLGEWAWEMYQRVVIHEFRDMAIACLGKKEVEKRLKELV